MIARAAGAVLILVALSTALILAPFALPQDPAEAGWTGLTEITNVVGNTNAFLHDSYYVTSVSVAWHFPVFAELFAGVALILFSKPVGRLLAKGLNTAPPAKAN